MNAYLLCINLCFILITQTIHSNNEPQNNDYQTLKRIYNGACSAGNVCRECVGGICKFLIDHGKGEAAAERVPKLEAKIDRQDQQREETEIRHHKERAEDKKQRADADQAVAKAIERTPLEKTQQVVSIAANVTFVAGAAYSTSKAVYHHFNPTKEQLLREEQVASELRKIRARHAIRECFVKQRKTPKDSDNVPFVCKEKFDEFVTVATEQEVEETKRLVNLR